MMVVIIALTTVELVCLYFSSRRLSRPVEYVSQQLHAIETLNFDTPSRPPSNIQEIAKLESAASLLRTSLKSFSSFVPLDVVRQLIKSGIPLTPGVDGGFIASAVEIGLTPCSACRIKSIKNVAVFRLHSRCFPPSYHRACRMHLSGAECG